MKTWKNKNWMVSVEKIEAGKKLVIKKNGIVQHKEVIAPGGDENCPLSIPNYVMGHVLDMIE